ncbi:hypothetical protein D3OALGB2SA_2179 [Olavius algarvensis associated proteobacterium Delta 3]|nr:hypothetical protein D3OALGB2SA_2179 [Olavius algarvensis associated proteobacterium Delta 3]
MCGDCPLLWAFSQSRNFVAALIDTTAIIAFALFKTEIGASIAILPKS